MHGAQKSLPILCICPSSLIVKAKLKILWLQLSFKTFFPLKRFDLKVTVFFIFWHKNLKEQVNHNFILYLISRTSDCGGNYIWYFSVNIFFKVNKWKTSSKCYDYCLEKTAATSKLASGIGKKLVAIWTLIPHHLKATLFFKF